MRILLSGASGLIGSSLLPSLTARGNEVSRLVRAASKTREGEIAWDPPRATIDGASLEGFGAVVHLAGENIAAGRWTAEKKRRILESRRNGTRLLADALSRLSRPPRVLVSASAVGYYGDRGDEKLHEESKPGKGFLSEVCIAWEEATKPALLKGIRVVRLRIGMVLSAAGGALEQMLRPFRLGLGGRIGRGRQYMSWIAVDDLVGAIIQSIENERLEGAVNAVAPTPVTNLEFAKTLGQVVSRPALLPAPALALRVLFGEMAEELLLASTRVEPARLLSSGYRFSYPELEGALRHILGR